jgi:TPR repeat protein
MKEALSLLTEAAEAGFGPALAAVAFSYDHGYGVAKDQTRAFELYTAASKKGVAWATRNVGYYYEGGKYMQRRTGFSPTEEGWAPVQRDIPQARMFYQAAAAQGHTKAAADLLRVGKPAPPPGAHSCCVLQ